MKYYIKKIKSQRISRKGNGFVDIQMIVETEEKETEDVVVTFTRKEWEEVHRLGYFIK